MHKPLTIFVPHCSDLLTDHLPHGDGLIAHGFISNLARRGHRLHVAAQRVALRSRLHSNITLHEIPVTASGPLVGRLEYMLRVRRLLNKLKKDCRFDLIHQLNTVFTGTSLAMIGSGLPLVLGTYVARWPDDPDSLVARSKWTRGVLSLGRTLISAAQQRQADVLLLTTPAASNRLPQPGDVRDRIQFLPHGLDTEFFSPGPGWDSDENLRADQLRPSILFFANVSPRKGIWTLVDAFPEVVRSVPNVVLRIAGDGGILPDVKRRVAALDCARQVEFLGRQERSQAPRLYRSASIYCLPSYGEPYATTVLEAMSCAKPIIVTDAGGLSHMVHDRGGKKVPVGDAASLAVALRDLLLNPSLRCSMGRYNRRLAETTMTWEAVTQRLEEIYRVTIEKNRSPRRQHNPHNENPPASRAPQVRVQEGMSLSSVAGPKELT